MDNLDLTSKTFSLDYVVSIYNSKYGNSYADIASVTNGKINSFAPLSITSLRRLLIKLLKASNYKNTDKFEQSSQFQFPVLYFGNNMRDLAFVAFSEKKRDIRHLSTPVVLKNLPTTLFIIKDAYALSVFERVGENAYMALNLPNISNNGSVCLGGKKPSKDEIGDPSVLMSTFYNLFWNGAFSTHSDSTGNNWSKGVYNYKSRKNAKIYSLKDLV